MIDEREVDVMSKENQGTTPLVTVIMPAYNAERFIEEAIMSVVNQTLTDWELLVIDDGSSDGTRDVVARLSENDERIKLVINEENMGVAKTRNRGFGLANGKFVALLDSDDYWNSCFLEKMLARTKETDADIVYCSYELVDEENKKVCSDFIVPERTTFKESIVRSVITCSTVLLKAEIAKNHSFPTNVYHEDIALWFQLLRDGKTAMGVTDVLAAYRQRANSRSADKIRSACRRWTIYRKHLKMPFFQSVITTVKYAYYGVKKFKRI